MRRILYVGDPHVTPEELGDCRRLRDFIVRVARDERVDEVCFLGDQHHTHAVLRLEVVGFWLETFDVLERELPGVEVVCLVGNHDMPGDSSLALHAMMCYGGTKIVVVDKPVMRYGVLHVPYYSDREAFVRDCNEYAGTRKSLVCHQTFDGSKYENGFPASDGVDLSAIPQTDILSGHIHTQQTVTGDGKKVWYPGTPRWRIKSDENVAKAIWVVDRDGSGAVVAARDFDTSGCCRARLRFEVKQGMPLHLLADADQAIHHAFDAGHLVAVDVEGEPGWVDQQIADLPQGLLVRAVRLVDKAPQVRESEGIERSFQRFLGGFQALYGTSPDRLRELAKEKLGV